jgi:glycosyltransferase involved in cell wall biosynthesis
LINEANGVSKPTGRPLRVVALIAAYNEEDVIDSVIRDLVRQRLDVYVIDNHSTDSTADRARSWLGRGVIGVEAFPREGPGEGPGQYRWADLLRRKEELAVSLDADWFLHQDADEFRDSPWRSVDLLDAIALVDSA